MPLLRSCFYITESNSHRHKVFYFRHDIWRLVCERAMLSLKSDMLEEFKPKIASNAMAGRQLGYSHIRLLPKGHKLRPIMNLRRRYASRVNNKVLVPSINTVLAPIHNMLKFERVRFHSKYNIQYANNPTRTLILSNCGQLSSPSVTCTRRSRHSKLS